MPGPTTARTGSTPPCSRCSPTRRCGSTPSSSSCTTRTTATSTMCPAVPAARAPRRVRRGRPIGLGNRVPLLRRIALVARRLGQLPGLRPHLGAALPGARTGVQEPNISRVAASRLRRPHQLLRLHPARLPHPRTARHRRADGQGGRRRGTCPRWRCPPPGARHGHAGAGQPPAPAHCRTGPWADVVGGPGHRQGDLHMTNEGARRSTSPCCRTSRCRSPARRSPWRRARSAHLRVGHRGDRRALRLLRARRRRLCPPFRRDGRRQGQADGSRRRFGVTAALQGNGRRRPRSNWTLGNDGGSEVCLHGHPERLRRQGSRPSRVRPGEHGRMTWPTDGGAYDVTVTAAPAPASPSVTRERSTRSGRFRPKRGRVAHPHACRTCCGAT